MKIVVLTVTGDQGSSVPKNLLKDTNAKHQVLGVTRNPDSEKPQALAKLGVTLIKGDLSDPTTYQDELNDIDAAYVNADFWTYYLSNGYDADQAMKSEIRDSIGAIAACVKAGVKHINYSTLDQVEKDECPHFEFKNFVEQTGLWVKEALNNPDKWIGKDMYATTSSLTISEMSQVLEKVSNGKVKVQTLGTTYEEFHKEETKTGMGIELWLAFKLIIDGKMDRTPEIITSIPGTWNFEQWAKQDSTLKEWFKF